MGAIWNGVVFVFKAIDRFLVWMAAPFGVHIKDWKKRLGLLLGMYSIIYLLALLTPPIIALPVLAFGYLGVLAVGRAWSANEKIRSDIVKKLKTERSNPDELPDLRWTALISALQLVVLFPLVFSHVQQVSPGLYNLPGGAPSTIWIAFTFDGFCKSLLDWSEVYKVHFSDVAYGGGWAAHLVMLKRLTFDFILIQGIIRIISIRRDVRDAIGALSSTSENAALIGRRAVVSLCRILKHQDDDIRNNAANALLKVGDIRSVNSLIHALQDSDAGVREYATAALKNLGDQRAVIPLKESLDVEKDRIVRQGFIEALEVLEGIESEMPSMDQQDAAETNKPSEEIGSQIRTHEEIVELKNGVWKPCVGTTIKDPMLNAEWACIPPGKVQMRQHGKGPTVTLTNWLLMKTTPVTLGEYQEIMSVNLSRHQASDSRAPVVAVSWFDAIHFCNALSKMSGLTPAYRIHNKKVEFRGVISNGYRLPTEAEWEYACRAGTDTYFWNGDCIERVEEDPNLDKIAWYGKNSGGKIHPVGEKPPNPWGLYDMHGNVFELCSDWFYKYPLGCYTNHEGPEWGDNIRIKRRIMRGGSYASSAFMCGSARAGTTNHYSIDPSDASSKTGIRCVRTIV